MNTRVRSGGKAGSRSGGKAGSRSDGKAGSTVGRRAGSRPGAESAAGRVSETFRFDASMAVLTLIPFIMVLGNSILVPVIPAIRTALHLSEAVGGLIITAFSVPAGVLIPFAGFLADRYGRKAVMVPGLVVYGLGGFLAVAAALFLKDRAFTLLMVGRVIQGLGAAGTANIAMALAGDLFAGQARSQAMGVLEASNGFGKVASPILGAALGLLTWFAPIVFFASLTIPTAIAVGIWAKDAKPKERQSIGEYLHSIASVFGRKGAALGASFAAGATALFLLFGVLFYLSETLEKQMHMEGVLKGLVLALPVLASSVMAYVSGTYIQKKVSRRLLVTVGLGLIGLALASLTIIKNPWFLYAAIFFIGVGSGTALAALNVLVTSSVEVSRRGMITSGYGAVRFFGVALGPPLFGLVMGKGSLVLFASATALAIGVAALSFFLIDERRLAAEK